MGVWMDGWIDRLAGINEWIGSFGWVDGWNRRTDRQRHRCALHSNFVVVYCIFSVQFLYVNRAG